jgi:DNA-binding NarL/FixJ family response regulator
MMKWNAAFPRILIADNNEFRRNIIKGRLLDADLSSRVTAVGAHGRQAIDAVLIKEPDVVVLAIGLPHLDGVMAFSVIRQIRPDVRIVVMTADENRYFLEHLEKVRADAYIPTDPNPFELRSAVLATTPRECSSPQKESSTGEGAPTWWADGRTCHAEEIEASDFAYILSAAA